MNRLYPIIIFFVICNICNAQNLVPNGDFEQYQNCPVGFNDFQGFVSNWLNPCVVNSALGTPDYYNQCAIGDMSVPTNLKGSQASHSGVAYCGIVIARESSNTDYREFIEVPLTSSLAAGTCYHFEMYMSLAEHSRYTTDAVGAYFSDTLISGVTTANPLPFTPQINNTAGVTPDTLNWTLVSGDYTAGGGENYLIVGNFKDHSNTVTTIPDNNVISDFAYIYIDDVSVTPCITQGINEFNENTDVSVYPNPSTGNLTVKTNTNELSEISIYDVSSRLLLHEQFRTMGSINIGKFTPGIYLYEVRSGDGTYRTGKIVRN